MTKQWVPGINNNGTADIRVNGEDLDIRFDNKGHESLSQEQMKLRDELRDGLRQHLVAQTNKHPLGKDKHGRSFQDVMDALQTLYAPTVNEYIPALTRAQQDVDAVTFAIRETRQAVRAFHREPRRK